MSSLVRSRGHAAIALALAGCVTPPAAAPEELAASTEATEAARALDSMLARIEPRRELDFDPSTTSLPPHPVPLDGQSEAQLAEFFALGRAVDGRSLADDVAAVSSAVQGREHSPPLGLDGLVALQSHALGSLTVEWGETHATTGRLDGPLFVRRGSPQDAVDAFLAAERDSLARAFGIAALDELTWVGSSETADGDLEEHVYQRTRDGVAFDTDLIEVWATNERHRVGAGLVWRVHGVWHRTAPDRLPVWIAEDEARRLAGDALGADLSTEDTAFVSRTYFCGTPDDSCRPAWDVRSTIGELFEEHGPDSALIDGETGAVLARPERSRDYAGTVRVTSSVPYDTTDTFRAFSRAQLSALSGTYNLGADGSYNWTPSTTTANVGLGNPGITPPFELRNSPTYNCASGGDGMPGTFNLTVPLTNITYAANETTMARSRAIAWNLIQWTMRSVASHSNFLQLDDELYYTITNTGGGQATSCGDHIRLVAGMGTDASGTVDAHDRIVVFHETAHHIMSCTRGWSAGCPGVLGDPRTHITETTKEGMVDTWAHWANAWETNTGGIAASVRYLTYGGDGVAGDLSLNEADIDGTDPATTMDDYWPCRDHVHVRGR